MDILGRDKKLLSVSSISPFMTKCPQEAKKKKKLLCNVVCAREEVDPTSALSSELDARSFYTREMKSHEQ